MEDTFRPGFARRYLLKKYLIAESFPVRALSSTKVYSEIISLL
jgi:hypothetical protein